MKHHSHQKNITLSKFVIVVACMIVLNLFGWNSTTQAASANITLTPERDKYVTNGVGDNSGAIVIAGKYFDGPAEGVLGFDISRISGLVTSAILKINVHYTNDSNPPLYLKTEMNIYGSNTDDWAESDGSIPSKDHLILSSQGVDRVGTYTYAVTDYLKSQTDGYATFVLEPVVTTASRFFFFYSTEAYYGSGASLIIDYLDPVATLSSSALNEDNVNGGTVNIALEDTTFTDSTLDKANFRLTGGIDGLSVGAVDYIDDTHCLLTLAYNGKDFDRAFSFGVVIDKTELTALKDLEARNTLTVTAVNDMESLSLSYDGTINEGAEDGEVITVTISGGQFAAIHPDNWTLGNLPQGVSKGSVTRVNDHTVNITLSGNATYDYDVDITNMSVSCTAEEYCDSTGGGTISRSGGVRFTANNDPEILTLSDSGDITEDHEDGKTFIATLTGGQFAPTLNPYNWSISGQPYGCSLSSAIERLDDHYVRLKIYGLSQVDYDSDITDAVVSCTNAEYTDSTGNGTLKGTGITFHATNDAETFNTQSYNYQTIYEGQENGKIIWATISGGEFPWVVNLAHWSVSGLPDGVSYEIAKDQYYKPRVNITLSGNAAQDYDSDKTLTITCSEDGYSDSTGNGALTSSSVRLTAINDPESISISDDGSIREGAEDGEIISVTLTGGTFPETINPDNWTVENLPWGVTKGAVTSIDAHTVEITLAGNAQIDYDADITNVSVTCGVSEYNDHTGGGPLTCGTGVRLIADNDIEALSASDDGRIEEGAEDGEVITATLTGGIFSNPINAANWSVTGLPAGVSKGTVTRIDNHHVAIRLSGNALVDFDSNISDITVTCTADEYSGTLRTSLSASGITIKAINDAESISIANNEAIYEGNEDGKTIEVTLSGGRFAPVLNPANWTLNGLPQGVTKGTVTRVDDWHVNIMLSGSASRDYDIDITDVSVTCTAEEYMDNTGGGPLICNTGVRFEAVDDAETLSISDDGLIIEGAEDGEIITATLTGGVFSNTVNPANWSITGQPAGIRIGAVTRIDDNTVALRLSGVAEEDYDTDITAMRVVCAADEYEDSSGTEALTSGTGVRFTAINDTESIAISDDGLITEGAEDGEMIRVTLSGGIFANPVNPKNWSVTGLPSGVEKGTVTRIDGHTVVIKLAGNADIDFDQDMTGISVSCTPDEYTGTLRISLTASGIVIKAVDDPEVLTLSDSGIKEGRENGGTITVKISGGQFARDIDAQHWTVENLPIGVSIGSITRADAHTVILTLAGKSTKDYDEDITDVKVTCEADQYHSGDNPLSAQYGVVFVAVIEKDTPLQNETEASVPPKPTPNPTPMPSGGQSAPQVSDNVDYNVDYKDTAYESRSLKATLIRENTASGTILIEFGASSLPAGTKAIRFENGTQIRIEGSSGKVQLEVSKEDLNEEGELIFIAVDDEGVPLASLRISVIDQGQPVTVDAQSADRDFPVFWVIAGLAGIAAAVMAGCIVLKKRKLN